jgi:hypothetical protein
MEKPENSTGDNVAQESTDLKVTFATSLREHTRALRSFMLRQTAGRLLYAFWIGGPIAALVYLNLREPDPFNWWLCGGLVVAGNAALYSLPWLQALSLRKGQPDFYEPQITTLNENGVHIQLPHGNIELTWKAIYCARETGEFIFIQVGKNVSYFLPKRVLDAELLSRVRGVLRSHLGTRARV